MYFLKNVVQHSVDHFDDLTSVIFVLPGRRAGVFLKKYINEIQPKTQWSPKILSFNEFAAEYTDFDVMDSITLRFELYTAYCEIVAEPEEFEKFDVWASQILSDFNAIDNYLCDPKLVFQDLRNIKEIEGWSFNIDPLGADQESFLQFWKVLGKLYDKFIENLSKTRSTYSGNLMRYFSLNIDELMESDMKMSFCFAGFNALSSAEKKIIQYCSDKHNTLIFWDYDTSYISNNINPAGHFLRQQKEMFPDPRKLSASRINDPNKKVKIISTPNAVGQVRYVGQVLSDKPSGENLAIVLADENLLIPTLESLSEQIKEVNITMGMSFMLTPLYKVLDQYIALHYYAENKQKQSGYYSFLLKDFALIVLEFIQFKLSRY